jgi:hypothetical protein
MADVAAVSSGRRMVIKIDTAYGSSPTEIQRRLRSVYGEGASDDPTAAELPVRRRPSFRTPECCASEDVVFGTTTIRNAAAW